MLDNLNAKSMVVDGRFIEIVTRLMAIPKLAAVKSLRQLIIFFMAESVLSKQFAKFAVDSHWRYFLGDLDGQEIVVNSDGRQPSAKHDVAHQPVAAADIQDAPVAWQQIRYPIGELPIAVVIQ